MTAAAIADRVRRDGVADVAPMPSAAVEAFRAYLAGRPQYHGHVHGASVAPHQPGNSTCWSASDVLAAPAFFEFALGLTDVAAAYLEQLPRLYSVNAFTTYPIAGPLNPDIQEWHRDKDDVRFLALFVYLTDVGSVAEGAHLYKMGTHNGPDRGTDRAVLGPAGTAFVADTRGLHMGLRPSAVPRTMAWARWGVSDPPASYVWDASAPAHHSILGARYPTNAWLRESIRLVVQ